MGAKAAELGVVLLFLNIPQSWFETGVYHVNRYITAWRQEFWSTYVDFGLPQIIRQFIQGNSPTLAPPLTSIDSRQPIVSAEVASKKREIAYRLYERNGKRRGTELEDWLEAEREFNRTYRITD